MSSKVTFQQCIFDTFLVVFGAFGLSDELDDKYQKNPVSVAKIDISDVIIFINAFISAYDSTDRNLAAKTQQKWPLLD